MSIVGRTTRETSDFTPQNIPGLALWLDAADATTLSLTGTTVAQWRDKSGNSHILTGVNSNIYTSNSIQITGSVSSGVGDLSGFTNSTFSTNMSNRSIFIVYAQTRNAYSQFIGFGSSNASMFNSTDRFRYALNPGTNKIDIYGNSGSFFNESTAVFNGLQRTILTDIGNASGISFFANGTSGGTWTYGGTTLATTTNPGIQIARIPLSSTTIANEFYNGFIFEIIAFNTALTTSERQTVEGYLAAKWQTPTSLLTLPSSHPFQLARPISRPFQPTDIEGCALWLDAADASTVSFSSGTSISQWRDKSGNANNVLTVTGSPTYTSNGVQYTKSNSDCMRTSSTIAMAINATTIYCVVRFTGDTGIFNMIGLPDLASGGCSIRYFGGILNVQGDANDFGGQTYYVNGTFQPTNTNSTYSALHQIAATNRALTGNSRLTIGDNFFSRFFNGFIHEVIVFNSAPSNSQRQQVESYLAWKWGLRSGSTANLPITNTLRLFPAMSTVFTPRNIAGLSLWLDAADSSTVSTSPGTSNVTQWRDKSVNERHTNSVTGTPQFQNNDIVFNGSSSMFGPILNTTNVLTGFFVGTVNSSTAVEGRIVSLGTAGTAEFRSPNNTMLFIRLGTTNSIYTFRNPSSSAAGNIVMGQRIMAASIFNGTSNAFFLNGTTPGGIPSSTGNFNYSRYGLGCDAGGIEARLFNGIMNEVILFNSALTSSQRQQVEGYLAAKWRLQSPLPISHPFKKSSP